MSQVNFESIITELSDKNFNDAKSYLSDYLPFYYVNIAHADRNLITEKVGQFLEQFERKCFVKDDDLPVIYAEELIGMIDNCAEPGTRAFKYLNHAKMIKENLKHSQKEDITSDIDDITAIYLCFVYEFNKNRKLKINDLNFDVLGVDFKNILENIDLENPNAFKIPSLIKNNSLDLIDEDSKKKATGIQKGLSLAQKQVIDLVDKLTPKKADQPIRDTIDEINHYNYSKHNFMKLLLIMALHQPLWVTEMMNEQ